MNNVFGIDIAKQSFEVLGLLVDGSELSMSVSNTPRGISGFIRKVCSKVDPTQSIFVMEASGSYYLVLAYKLHEAGYKVKVVNPLVIRRFSQMHLSRTKTDRQDARMIAKFGQQLGSNLADWEPAEPVLMEMKQLLSQIELMKKQLTMSKNFGESLSQIPIQNKTLIKERKKYLKSLENHIDVLEKELDRMAQLHFKQTYEALNSIPGVGKKTTALFIALTHNFTRFDSAKQLASYVGICPKIFQSGSSVKAKERIVKMGQSTARAYLYMAAFSAMKYNQACVDMADRLREKGKHYRQVRVAVAHKLLRIIFALGKKKTTFQTEIT